MAGTEGLSQTREQRRTARLKARFDAFIHDNYPREYDDFTARNYAFYVQDKPSELWACSLSSRRAPITENGTAELNADKGQIDTFKLWLLWDGQEVISYDEDQVDEAFTDLINGQKSRRLDSKLKYYTSPLTISAVLALILFLLIAALELGKYEVPNQLWSVFTAVVAFYFGRESSRGSAEPTPQD